ncbi:MULTISPECIES: OmpH family outer membrane protein [Spirosoma]|uniref:OmpH family outer membrane protein n=1 Tax=Spirosoma liriopis TaxID=2937440 RepID=A0ABT0HIW7_9BACT|nr:OmpH family outer membrane protein [Spirosoma oryzicola]MCK8492108.1 OmpH family outer membrane protein [Spirosoma liriopis]UHG91529.1 OmpH family outer membrane protein [Spirosoma oryzicola]
MKNASLILNVVLTIAVAVLYYLHFKDRQPETTSTAAVPAEAKGKAIVYVNVDSLLTKYEYFKDTQKVLESKRFQLENDLTAKGRNLQNKVAFFQQRAATMTQEQGRATEASLQKEQQDILAYRERAAQNLAVEEQNKNKELYDQIYDYLKKENAKNKYEFVLGYTKGGGILFADPSSDQTSRILAGLNQEYKTKQDKPAKK